MTEKLTTTEEHCVLVNNRDLTFKHLRGQYYLFQSKYFRLFIFFLMIVFYIMLRST